MTSLPPPPKPGSWPAATGTRARPRLRTAAVLGVLALLVLAAFHAGLGGGFLYTDRSLLLAGHARVTAGESWWSPFGRGIWFEPRGQGGEWRPLKVWSYSFDWWVSGGSPVFLHAVNLALHVVVYALAFVVFLRFGYPPGGLALACWVLALHPLHQEALYIVSQGRQELLVCVFMLLALYQLAPLLTRDDFGSGLLAALWLVPALLCKETALVLGPWHLAALWAWRRLSSPLVRWHLLLLAVLAGGWMLVKFALFGGVGNGLVPGPGWPPQALDVGMRLRLVGTSFRAFARMLGKGLRLLPTSVSDAVPVAAGPADPAFGVGALVGIGLLWLAWRWHREWPRHALALLLPPVALLPLTNLHPLNHFISEHHSYMILISMLPAVALLLERLRVFPRLLPLLVGLLLVAYCHEDRRQASVFADDERFLTYNVALTPYGAEVVHGLAGLHFRAQDYRACVATVDRFLRAMDAGLYTGFSPSPPRLIEMYVRSLAALGDGERAERVLASATLSWPEPGLFTLWRWLCLQRGDSPAAAAVTALERSRSGG